MKFPHFEWLQNDAAQLGQFLACLGSSLQSSAEIKWNKCFHQMNTQFLLNSPSIIWKLETSWSGACSDVQADEYSIKN